MTRPLMRARPARIHSWLVPREAMPSFESSRSTVRRLDVEALFAILNHLSPAEFLLVHISGASQVCLVYLVCLVCLVCLVEPDRLDRPNRPNEQDRLPAFFSILLEEAALLEKVFVNNGGRFGRKLSTFLQQSFNIFPDEIRFEIDLIADLLEPQGGNLRRVRNNRD